MRVPQDPLANEWVRERVLGEGGMGTVSLVRNRVSGLRFAMKRIRGDLLGDAAHRRMFLDELQTWIGLPAHPNLAACRFFRTVGDDVAVFMDVAEAGTLRDWIASGQLRDVSAILDVAIQLAWGLHAAHEYGVVHQDVKPANVLMASSGVPSVSDFGLASTAGAALGMTRAYCSPEQAAGRAVGPPSDQWAFGVSVLEMFVGEVTWMSGVVARQALDAWLRGPDGSRMPARVADVLRRCFEPREQDRWPGLAAAADALVAAWEAGTRRPYPRSRPLVARRPDVAPDLARVGSGGGRWRDPAQVLQRARQRAGHAPVREQGSGALASPRGRLVAEMADFREAVRLYEGLPSPTDEDLLETGRLLEELAHLHQAADDLPGAVAAMEGAIAHWRRLCAAGDVRRRDDLGRALLNKGILLAATGAARALPAYDEALAVARAMDADGRRAEGLNLRMRCSLSQGIALNELGRPAEALPLLEQVTAWLLDDATPYADRSEAGGPAFGARAESLRRLGRRDEAMAIQRKVVALYEAAVAQGLDARFGLAAASLNLANDLAASGDASGAHVRFDAAIRLWTAILEDGAMRDVAHELARTLAAKARLLRSAGNGSAAEPLFARAIAVLEQRVDEEAQHQSTIMLTDMYAETSDLLIGQGRFAEALAIDTRALAMFARLVEGEGRVDQHTYLAGCHRRRAWSLDRLGRARDARAARDSGIAILEEAVLGGRDDLVPRLAADMAETAESVRAADPSAADALCDRALAVLDRPTRADTRRARAMAHLNKGCARAGLGDVDAAVQELSTAADLYRELAAAGVDGASDSVLRCLVNQSEVLSDDISPATLAWRAELIDHLEAHVEAGADGWRDALLSCLRTQAVALADQDLSANVRTLTRGLGLARRSPPLRAQMAAVFVLRAHSLLDLDRREEALADLAAAEGVVRELRLGGQDVSRFASPLRDLRAAITGRSP